MRHTTDSPPPLLSVLFSFGETSFPHTLQLAIGFVYDITHTAVASNCQALHIPRNHVDPTRGARPFPRSSHAFNYEENWSGFYYSLLQQSRLSFPHTPFLVYAIPPTHTVTLTLLQLNPHMHTYYCSSEGSPTHEFPFLAPTPIYTLIVTHALTPIETRRHKCT